MIVKVQMKFKSLNGKTQKCIMKWKISYIKNKLVKSLESSKPKRK